MLDAGDGSAAQRYVRQPILVTLNLVSALHLSLAARVAVPLSPPRFHLFVSFISVPLVRRFLSPLNSDPASLSDAALLLSQW